MNSAATTQRKTENVKGKERVRGPKLAILVKRTNGVPVVEGLARAGEDRVIASNKRLDKALVGSKEWRDISDVFVCWSGTMTGYEKPGKKLGKSVVYVDPETKQRYVFPVPEDYKGTKNAILVAEHPDYTLDRDGKDLVVAVKNIENVSLIERFPSEDGWYLTDEKHGIPRGNKVYGSNNDARYLWRIDSRVGPVARGYYGYGYWRDVVLDGRPSDSLGVAVEAPDTNELIVRKENGRLIVEGTPEQLETAIKLLKTIEK